jgi:hypothetical protein
MRHVRFEGSRIMLVRVPHHATNESQLYRALCDLSSLWLFSRSANEYR